MNELKLENKKIGLVVVAHPDDETIWCGGIFLRYPKVHWTVFSLCRLSDADRKPKFFKVMKKYGVSSLMTDLEDEGIMNVKQSIPVIKKLILKNLKNKKIDYIFSHNLNGEYGHERHIGVHLAIQELFKEKKLLAQKKYFFCYKTNAKKKILNDDKKANHYLNLTMREWQQKKKIVNELYGFSKKSFEYVSCLKKETYQLSG